MNYMNSGKNGAPALAGRQEEIVKAAAKIFKKRGYHAATIREIADEVGLLKGSLYHHIQSKEQLLMDVIMSAVKTLQAGIEEVVRRDLTPSEKLRQFTISHMRSFETHDDEVSVFFNEISTLPETLKEKLFSGISTYEDIWLTVIRSAIENGDFRRDVDPRVTLYAILGMCNWTYKWYRRQGRLSNTEIAEIYTDLFLSGILPRSDGTPGNKKHL